MGFIIAFQVEFLKFEPHNQGSSVGACFITAFLELAIFVGLTYYERKEQESTVSRPEYLKFNAERPRESSMKGIALVDLGGLKREEEKGEVEKIDLLWTDYHSNIIPSFMKTILNQ